MMHWKVRGITSGENISGEMREDERYRFYFQDKLEIPILEKNFPHDREILMEILELLVETVTSRKKFLRICGEEKPKEVVKSRLMKLDSMHIQYVMECLKSNTTQVRNIKQYLLATLYDNLTLEQALEVYDKIPAERMNGIKSIGFSLEDGSIYSGMFDLMVGGEVQAEVVNHIQHYRESPLVQKAISDMKTLLEKRQASKELEERPNIRQSVREALKNRKKAQEQQPNQEQVKPKKAKKKGEMEL